MADKFLLVPGTGGVKLAADGDDFGFPFELGIAHNFWFQLVAPSMTDALSDRLRMEYVDDAEVIEAKRTTLDPAISKVGAGDVLRVTAYGKLPAAFSAFPYDWRQDMRQSAKELLAWLKARAPANGRWRLACHSQGGLVVLIAARMLAVEEKDRAAFSRLVSRVVFVGVPVLGTVNAAEALVNGGFMTWLKLPGTNGLPRISSAMVRAVRSWPSIYQMLPVWTGVMRDEPAGVPDDNLFQPKSWGDLVDDPDAPIQEALLRRARMTWEQYLQKPFRNLRGVGLSLFMSRNRRTNFYVHYKKAGLQIPDKKAAGDDGDSLVPVSRVLLETRDELGDGHFHLFKEALEHSRLFMDDGVVHRLGEPGFLGFGGGT